MNPADIRVGKTYRSKSGRVDREVIAWGPTPNTVKTEVARIGKTFYGEHSGRGAVIQNIKTFARWADHEVVELP